MKLPNRKAIAMWDLPKDGETCPSKYTTLVNIEKRLNEYNPPWESYFENHINEDDMKVTFKARKVREQLWEPMWEDELNVISL